MNGYYVYFLRSKRDGTFYIGQTNNIGKRIERHNKALVKSTKNRAPFDLIYTESYNTRREAMLREKYLKSIAGFKEKEAIIESFLKGL